jgi:hypothetical protein
MQLCLQARQYGKSRQCEGYPVEKTHQGAWTKAQGDASKETDVNDNVLGKEN